MVHSETRYRIPIPLKDRYGRRLERYVRTRSIVCGMAGRAVLLAGLES